MFAVGLEMQAEICLAWGTRQLICMLLLYITEAVTTHQIAPPALYACSTFFQTDTGQAIMVLPVMSCYLTKHVLIFCYLTNSEMVCLQC